MTKPAEPRPKTSVSLLTRTELVALVQAQAEQLQRMTEQRAERRKAYMECAQNLKYARAEVVAQAEQLRQARASYKLDLAAKERRLQQCRKALERYEDEAPSRLRYIARRALARFPVPEETPDG